MFTRLPKIAIVLVLTLSFVTIGHASEKSSKPPVKASKKPQIANVLKKAQMQEWFDKKMPALLKKHKVVGTTVSLVHKGKILFAKGYGYGDFEKKKPVDPAKTLFRVGSISKLFVWTAIMQLVEQGKVKLDADIRVYLKDLKLSKKFGPITISHLMGHRPGLEDRLIGLFTKDPKELLTLKQVIAQVPKRVLPPGKELAYSNYGSMLAGYIVETVSGMSFESYIEKNIFQPLQMQKSTFVQPLPAKLKPFISKGYIPLKKGFKPKSFELINGTPAGGMSSTAVDMANFMLAHLQLGAYQGKKILKVATAKKMHTCHSRQIPGGNCFAHGFMELSAQKPRSIGHGGDTIYFHSLMILVPEHQLGFFVSSNTSTGMSATHLLFRDWFQKVFNKTSGAKLAQKQSNAKELDRFVGSYHTNRHAETEPSKLMKLFMKIDVSKSKENELEIIDFITMKKIKLVKVAPLTFQQKDGWIRAFFYENKKKEVVGFMLNSMPVMLFKKPVWYESFGWNLFVLVFALILLLTGFIFRPIGLIAIFSKKHPVEGKEKWVGRLGFILCLAVLAFVGGLFSSGSEDFVFEKPSAILLSIPYLIFLLSGLTVAGTVIAWKEQLWGLFSRIHYSLFAFSLLLFSWFLYHWHLMG